jgi:hypothetical protein
MYTVKSGPEFQYAHRSTLQYCVAKKIPDLDPNFGNINAVLVPTGNGTGIEGVAPSQYKRFKIR